MMTSTYHYKVELLVRKGMPTSTYHSNSAYLFSAIWSLIIGQTLIRTISCISSMTTCRLPSQIIFILFEQGGIEVKQQASPTFSFSASRDDVASSRMSIRGFLGEAATSSK